ncbi:MAG: hypothetical protein WDN76_05200 [Alphaproteobacteria bacterium]
MVEKGGPTAQAGIDYQNSIATLQMAGLLISAPHTALQIIEVRLEAPANVDDIVVKYADGHTRWIQAKLNLAVNDAVWKGLWLAFDAQIQKLPAMTPDRLVLVTSADTSLTVRRQHP